MTLFLLMRTMIQNCDTVFVDVTENDAEAGVVSVLQRNGCYSQGNLADFNKFLSKEVGKEDFKVCVLINPFTAVMSLEKWPRKMQNCKALSLSVFFFALACERILIEMLIIESRCVTGPENILCAGMSMHLSLKGLKKISVLSEFHNGIENVWDKEL